MTKRQIKKYATDKKNQAMANKDWSDMNLWNNVLFLLGRPSTKDWTLEQLINRVKSVHGEINLTVEFVAVK